MEENNVENGNSEVINTLLNSINGKKKVNSTDTVRRAVAVLRVQGDTVEEVSEKLNLNIEDVETIIGMPDFEKLMLEVQSVVRIPEAKKLENGVNQALEKVYNLMTQRHVKPEVQLKAAFDILDRHLGKSTQRTESITFNADRVDMDMKALDERLVLSQERLAQLENQRKTLRESRERTKNL